MTTKLLTINFAHSNLLKFVAFPKKNCVFAQFSTLPQIPNHLENTDLIFIVVSPSEYW